MKYYKIINALLYFFLLQFSDLHAGGFSRKSVPIDVFIIKSTKHELEIKVETLDVNGATKIRAISFVIGKTSYQVPKSEFADLTHVALNRWSLKAEDDQDIAALAKIGETMPIYFSMECGEVTYDTDDNVKQRGVVKFILGKPGYGGRIRLVPKGHNKWLGFSKDEGAPEAREGVIERFDPGDY